jgi:hypothetical protein
MKALVRVGIKVHLHCFQYDRDQSILLEEICEKVYYYPRNRSIFKQFSILPFIVKTRNNKALLENLLTNDYPILFEGLHSCYFLNHSALLNRKKIVRSHNIEHDYYRGLSLKSKNWIEKVYFRLESLKLKRYESVLKRVNYIAAISISDEKYLQMKYGHTFLMLPSHPSDGILIEEGKGEYILYHGDLSVQENVDAVNYILDKIVPFVNFEFILAGRNPSVEILNKASGLMNVKVITNPCHDEMQTLVRHAQINFLPTFQATGFKLKLLNALFNGRFCLCTTELVEGTGLHDCCDIAGSPDEFVTKIDYLMNQNFNHEMIKKRTALLKMYFNSAVISPLVELI